MSRFKLTIKPGLMNIYALIPFIASIVTSIYAIYSLVLVNAEVISRNIVEAIMFIPIPVIVEVISYILSPYLIGLIGLAVIAWSIYQGKYSRALITLTIIYLYSVLFLPNVIETIPIYITGTIILLVSYNWARGIHYPTTTITQGKIKLLIGIIAEYALIYVITIAFSTWYTKLVSSILYTLPTKLPYPLSLMYSMIMETRIGVLILTVIAFYVLLWIINMFIETIVMKFTITRETALTIVKNELESIKKKLFVIETCAVMDYASSFLILIPLYPIMQTIANRIVGNIVAMETPLSMVLVYMIALAIYMLTALIIRRTIRSILQGTLPFRTVLALSILAIAFILILYYMHGYNPITVLEATINGKGIEYDPLKQYILKFEERVLTVENYAKHLEELVKFLIHLIWG